MKPISTLRAVGRPIAFYPALSKHVGGTKACLFLCQLMYWSDKTENALGVYKSSEQWEEETGLSYKEQATARRELVKRGLIAETHKRLEHRIYFKFNESEFDSLILAISGGGSSPNADRSVGGDTNGSFDHTEITTEITSEILSPKGDGDSLPAADDSIDSEQIKPKAKKPRCPVNQIVDLYHEVLPELPEVKVLTDTRRKYIQARWNEKANRQTLDFWKRYFEYVRQSPFLMGQTEGTHGKPPFRADLEWLMRPSNFAKVIEEKYHA